MYRNAGFRETLLTLPSMLKIVAECVLPYSEVQGRDIGKNLAAVVGLFREGLSVGNPPVFNGAYL